MFENNGLDAIRLSNILNHKSVCSRILPYLIMLNLLVFPTRIQDLLHPN